MSITFITGNTGKFKEAKAIIPDLVQHELDLPEIQELDPQVVIAAKLAEARKHITDTDLIVEDTSLYIDALNGLPGPLIKWFLERLGNDSIAELVQKTDKNATAEARCVIGYLAQDTDEPQFFTGTITGTIVTPRGENGFGWDALFQPTTSDRTLAEHSFIEKNNISLRAKAFQKLASALEAHTL